MHYYRDVDNYIELAKCFKAIYDTMTANPNLYLNNVETFYRPEIQNVFQNFVIFTVIAHKSEQK